MNQDINTEGPHYGNEALRHNDEENMEAMRGSDYLREIVCWAVLLTFAIIAGCRFL